MRAKSIPCSLNGSLNSQICKLYTTMLYTYVSMFMVPDSCVNKTVRSVDIPTCQVHDTGVYTHALTTEDAAALQCIKRILGKVQEMRDQRGSLEKQLRDLVQQDDITSALVTTERPEMKVMLLSWLSSVPCTSFNPIGHDSLYVK